MRQFLLRGFYLLLAIGFFFVALIVIEEPVATSSVERDSRPLLPLVSYVEIAPDLHRSEISVYGELLPRWDVTIKAQVNGEVTDLSPQFEAGAMVKQGTVLMTIEDTRYQAELTQAELSVAQAELELWQAKEKTELARKDWARSGFKKKPSDLALFLPQLSLSEHSLQSAKRQLQLAQRNLSYTQVQAPFGGLVTERFVGLGQLVFEGDPIVRLLDHRHLMLKVSLNEEQWKNLSSQWQDQTVPLFGTNHQFLGNAKAVRGGHRMDEETRQYPLYLEIDTQPQAGLIPGRFVRAQLPGKNKPGTLRIPQGALTREGLVWVVTPDNTLRSYSPEEVVFDGDQALVSPPKENDWFSDGRLRVATTPLAFYLTGLSVQPVNRVEG